jgi:hypothetical protein
VNFSLRPIEFLENLHIGLSDDSELTEDKRVIIIEERPTTDKIWGS